MGGTAYLDKIKTRYPPMQIVRVRNVYHIQLHRSTLIVSIALTILLLASAGVATLNAAMRIVVAETSTARSEVDNAIRETNEVRRYVAESCGDKLSALGQLRPMR
jgi:hypothetical protein